MKALFHTVLYKPLFNALVLLYALLGNNVGFAIIVLTIALKALLYPLMSSSIKAQKSLQELQPKLNELKKKHGSDKQALAQDTMTLYKENQVNPFSSCLPLIIQLPILLALYWVLRDGLGTTDFSLLYGFVQSPEILNPHFFGFDLSEPILLLAVMAGAAQYWQGKMLAITRPPKAAGEGGKDEDMMAMMNKQMIYFMPVLTVIIGTRLPGGLALYWFMSTFLTAVQQLVIFKKHDKDKKKEIAA